MEFIDRIKSKYNWKIRMNKFWFRSFWFLHTLVLAIYDWNVAPRMLQYIYALDCSRSQFMSRLFNLRANVETIVCWQNDRQRSLRSLRGRNHFHGNYAKLMLWTVDELWMCNKRKGKREITVKEIWSPPGKNPPTWELPSIFSGTYSLLSWKKVLFIEKIPLYRSHFLRDNQFTQTIEWPPLHLKFCPWLEKN